MNILKRILLKIADFVKGIFLTPDLVNLHLFDD